MVKDDVSMIVKAKGPSGPAKIHSDDPKHALGLIHYLRSIGYEAWIEDANGNEIEECDRVNVLCYACGLAGFHL